MKKFLRGILLIIIVLAVIAVIRGRDNKKTASQPVSGTQSSRKEYSLPDYYQQTAGKTESSEMKREETEEEATEKETAEVLDENGLRPDVKAAIDSYEEFIDEYCEFMESYDSSDAAMMLKYVSLLQKEVEVSEKFDKLGDEDLNDAELAYYTTVQLRCSEKLLAVSAKIG